MNGINWFFFILYLILAVYMINIFFIFIPMPSSVLEYSGWISFVAGIFLIWGAYLYYQRYRYRFGQGHRYAQGHFV